MTRPEKNSPEFDAFRDSYGDEIEKAVSFGGQEHDFYTRVKARYLTETIKAHFPDRAQLLNVLDVGCGHGLIHKHILQAAPAIKLSGTDVAAKVVEVARKNNPDVGYKDYDGSRLPYEDASFDVAFTICVMHHVPPAQWNNFLKEIHRVLTPGGILCVFEHNPYNPLTRHIVNSCPLDENAVLLKSTQLKGLMEKSGYTDLATKYILFSPFDHPVFQAVDNCLGWLPLGAQYFTTGTKP